MCHLIYAVECFLCFGQAPGFQALLQAARFLFFLRALALGLCLLQRDLGVAGGLALCRCGQSKNKPFCDNSHRDAGFVDAGAVKARQVEGFAAGGPLTMQTL